MRKNTFEASNIFFYSKNIQNMLEYWPYATRKKTFFFCKQYIFFDEIGYFNTEFVSTQHKKYKLILSHKTNVRKNPQYFLRTFRNFFESKKKIFENLGCLDENRVF